MMKVAGLVLFAVVWGLAILGVANAAEIPGLKSLTEENTTVFVIDSSTKVDDFTAPIAMCDEVAVTWQRGVSAVATAYGVTPLTNTVAQIRAGTSIKQFTTNQLTPLIVKKVAEKFTLIVDTPETGLNVTVVKVKCRERSGADTVVQQVSPSIYDEQFVTSAVTTSPYQTQFGWNVATEAFPPPWTGARYPGGTDNTGNELNNMQGWSYNKGVYGSTIYNIFETAYDFSMENTWRSFNNGGVAASHTFTEFNWDFFVPDLKFTGSGTSGTCNANDIILFSGGGSARVRTSSGSNPTRTVNFRVDYGQTSQGETYAGVSPSTCAGTVGAITTDYPTPNNFRPYILVYDHLEDIAAHTWSTSRTESALPSGGTFSVSAGYARHHGRIVTAAVHAGTATWAGGTTVNAGACNATNVGLSGTGFDGTQTNANDTIRWSWNADVTGITGFNPATGVLDVVAYAGAATVNFKLCNRTAGNLTTGSGVTINWLVDRYL